MKKKYEARQLTADERKSLFAELEQIGFVHLSFKFKNHGRTRVPYDPEDDYWHPPMSRFDDFDRLLPQFAVFDENGKIETLHNSLKSAQKSAARLEQNS